MILEIVIVIFWAFFNSQNFNGFYKLTKPPYLQLLFGFIIFYTVYVYVL